MKNSNKTQNNELIDAKIKRIFVVGCPRSGTTLLQNLLTNIPGSFSMPETYFFQKIAMNRFVAPRSLPPLLPFRYPDYINSNTAKIVVDSCREDGHFHLSAQEEKELCKSAEAKNLTVEDFFDKIMLSYAPDKISCFLIIEKTPIHTFHLSYIRSVFPDAIFLGIVRDPRDAYASFNGMLAIQGKPKRSVAEFSHLWNESLAACIKNNIDVIKYEDLIRRPVEIINKKLAKSRLHISALDKNNYSAILRPGPRTVCESKLKLGVLPNNFDRYKQVLEKHEIAEINHYCSSGMKRFNYEIDKQNKRNFSFAIKDLIKWNAVRISIWRNIIISKFFVKNYE